MTTTTALLCAHADADGDATRCPHTPPPDATIVEEWSLCYGHTCCYGHTWWRHFYGTRRRVGDLIVGLHGYQHDNGYVDRWGYIEETDDKTDGVDFETADVARALSAALLDTADELERLEARR